MAFIRQNSATVRAMALLADVTVRPRSIASRGTPRTVPAVWQTAFSLGHRPSSSAEGNRVPHPVTAASASTHSAA